MGGKDDDEHEMDYGTYTTKKPKKPILSISQIVLIVVVVSIGVSIFLGMSGFEVIPEEKIPTKTQQNPFECEKWFEEGKFLLNKNYWTQDVNLWSEDDREKFLELDKQYSVNCVITQEITQNLPKCTQMYVRIQELIDMMEDRQLNSIPIKEQREYNSNYDEYFKIRCDVIQDEIIQQINFMNTDKT